MSLQQFVIVIFLLFLPVGPAQGQLATPPRTLSEALSAEFSCPSGSHDSGASPGMVVRWCDVNRNGRPVYHGPVWRWYGSGKLEGKEYYLNGDAVGVWPSYYENGNRSSLGYFESGRKSGLWKYWDESGKLTTEVGYSDEGNSRTDYYVSGEKKATGTFTASGKIGKWTYFDQSGKKKAECDFGRGLFSLSTQGCRMIANELDPKGYSPPIPAATQGLDGSIELSVAAKVFKLTPLAEWTTDFRAGRQEELPVVFYPKGKQWRAPGANMYVRICLKKHRTFQQTVKNDLDDFRENVAEYQQGLGATGRLPSGLSYVLRSISYKPLIETDSPFSIVSWSQVHEQLAYLDSSDQTVILIVLTADSDQNLQQAMPGFQSLLRSVR